MSKQEKAVEKQGSGALTAPAVAFPTLANPESSSAVVEFIGESGTGVFDLPRLKVPTGGTEAWEVHGLKGKEYKKQIDCVIVGARHNQKAWYAKPMGADGGGPPDCSSGDGITGRGHNTIDLKGSLGPHDCLTCPWNQFESRRGDGGGSGKDCRDYAQLLVCTEDGAVPTLLTVPPASLKAVKKYMMDLMSAGKRPFGVVTRLELVSEKGPPPHSRIIFTYVRDTGFDFERSRQLSEALKAALFKIDPRRSATTL